MKLNNTIILPGDNIELSKSLLISLIKGQDVLTIVIFGSDQKSQDAVLKADIRADAIVSGIKRKVAWMQNQDDIMLKYLISLIEDGPKFKSSNITFKDHIGISISMTDKLMFIIPKNPEPDFIRMEKAFIKAGTII